MLPLASPSALWISGSWTVTVFVSSFSCSSFKSPSWKLPLWGTTSSSWSMIRWEEKQDECYSSLFIALIYFSQLKSQSMTQFPYQLQLSLPPYASPLPEGGGGSSAYERGGDAPRKFWIKPLKETDRGVAQVFLTPKRDHVKTQTIYIFLYFFACNPKRDLYD